MASRRFRSPFSGNPKFRGFGRVVGFFVRIFGRRGCRMNTRDRWSLTTDRGLSAADGDSGDVYETPAPKSGPRGHVAHACFVTRSQPISGASRLRESGGRAGPAPAARQHDCGERAVLAGLTGLAAIPCGAAWPGRAAAAPRAADSARQKKISDFVARTAGDVYNQAGLAEGVCRQYGAPRRRRPSRGVCVERTE
jgi:hypothetical protein